MASLVKSPSILILRLSSLGDIVLTTALITALRERYPASRIDLVIASEFESIAPVLPGVSRVHVFNKRNGVKGLRALRHTLRKERFDYVLDLHNALRTRILRRRVGRRLSVVDKRSFRRWMLVRFKWDILRDTPDVIGRYFETAARLGVTDDGRAPKLIAAHERDPKRIAIASGAKHWNKRWPPEYFRELAQILLDRGYEITFYGSQSDASTIEEIRQGLTGKHRSLAGETDLTDAAHSIAKCAVAITNDSGLMHVAQAVGTPVVALFGPTVTQFGFAPRTPNSIALEVEGLYCRPCTAIGMENCPEGHFRCLREITPQQVLATISGMSQ